MNFIGLNHVYGLESAGFRVSLGPDWEPNLPWLGWQRKGVNNAELKKSMIDWTVLEYGPEIVECL